MPFVAITPDGIVTTAGTPAVTGAASANAALADASDSSYVTYASAQQTYSFSTFSLPAGALVTSWQLEYRANSASASPTPRVGYQVVPGDGVSHSAAVSSGAIRFDAWVLPLSALGSGTAANQAAIDGVTVTLGDDTANSSPAVKVYQLDLYIGYQTVPVTTVTAPTGTVSTTTSPTATWTFNAGGANQNAYQIRVFTAAQYGAVGFDPAISAAAYDSGIVPSGAAVRSATIGPLANSTTYRCYVRTATTTLGAYQWSDYAFSAFSISLTTSDISTVVATPVSANGRNSIAITRNTGTPTWTSVDVQRSYDSGTTWTYVRGYTRFPVTTSPITVIDHEAPNGLAAIYRARATYQLAGLDVAGPWVTSGPATWSSTADWLKDPYTPANNLIVRVNQQPTLVRARRQGIFTPLGRPDAVVVTDVIQLSTGTLTFVTLTDAEAVALLKLLSSSSAVLLLQTPITDRWGSKYIAVGDIEEDRTAPGLRDEPSRYWQVPFVEISQPADTGIN